MCGNGKNMWEFPTICWKLVSCVQEPGIYSRSLRRPASFLVLEQGEQESALVKKKEKYVCKG